MQLSWGLEWRESRNAIFHLTAALPIVFIYLHSEPVRVPAKAFRNVLEVSQIEYVVHLNGNNRERDTNRVEQREQNREVRTNRMSD